MRRGWKSYLHRPRFENRPFSFEALLDLPAAALAALSSPLDLAIGLKPYPNVWAALSLARSRGARCILDVDDMDQAWRQGPAAWLAKEAHRPALEAGFEFSTHHPLIAKSLAPLGRVHPLDQGVDTGRFLVGPRSREKWLLYCAHLNVASSLEVLLRWLGPWLQEHSDWRLMVAGGGPLLSKYRSQYEGPQVQFSGPLELDAVAAWMRRSRICLAAYNSNPANQYRVPMKIGEYLASGRAVLCNAIEGLAALRPYLYLCRDDGSDFGKLLNSLLKKGGDGRETRGARWVRKHLDWDSVLERFLESLG